MTERGTRERHWLRRLVRFILVVGIYFDLEEDESDGWDVLSARQAMGAVWQTISILSLIFCAYIFLN